MDWLFAPIDPARAHEVSAAVAWHARSMVLAWGILAPLAVLAARFFKILPGQDWPRELDNQVWWRLHWMGHMAVLGLSGIGLILVWPVGGSVLGLHTGLGLALLAALIAQVLLGLCRGSKGGPSAPSRDGSLRGDHYDMTPRRRMFETAHKSLGYAALGLSVLVVVSGLWKANAPWWIWIVIALWWVGLAAAFLAMQRRGMAVETYQAIWGADPSHPGNRLPAPGWGMRRMGELKKERQDDVRSDRGDGL